MQNSNQRAVMDNFSNFDFSSPINKARKLEHCIEGTTKEEK